MSKAIALKPRLNEKTYGLAASRVYVFDVDRSVNKHSIARAVESQFEVKVIEVNTTNIHGKSKPVINIVANIGIGAGTNTAANLYTGAIASS